MILNNTQRIKKLFGVCPFDNEVTTISIQVGKYRISSLVFLKDIYNFNGDIADYLHMIIEMHKDELNQLDLNDSKVNLQYTAF